MLVDVEDLNTDRFVVVSIIRIDFTRQMRSSIIYYIGGNFIREKGRRWKPTALWPNTMHKTRGKVCSDFRISAFTVIFHVKHSFVSSYESAKSFGFLGWQTTIASQVFVLALDGVCNVIRIVAAGKACIVRFEHPLRVVGKISRRYRVFRDDKYWGGQIN